MLRYCSQATPRAVSGPVYRASRTFWDHRSLLHETRSTKHYFRITNSQDLTSLFMKPVFECSEEKKKTPGALLAVFFSLFIVSGGLLRAIIYQLGSLTDTLPLHLRLLSCFLWWFWNFELVGCPHKLGLSSVKEPQVIVATDKDVTGVQTVAGKQDVQLCRSAQGQR